MKISEIVRVDSRGRILIPSSVRSALALREQAYVMLIADLESREVRLIPFADPEAKLYELRITIDDAPGALAKAALKLAELGVDLLSTQSRTLYRRKMAEWFIVADLSKCKVKPVKLEKYLKEEGVASRVEVRPLSSL
ncbi:AbrB family transcriptional regulator [Candidatus Bathyarchaeota archaeon]|nr:MAG: AbrB family transcriptional regulator [Candidatus Hecatellales archaeon]RLI34462.1 MAG: AbrB family transcriptional regulator [Candidatus Bathyarchaeota archaeon]